MLKTYKPVMHYFTCDACGTHSTDEAQSVGMLRILVEHHGWVLIGETFSFCSPRCKETATNILTSK